MKSVAVALSFLVLLSQVVAQVSVSRGGIGPLDSIYFIMTDRFRDGDAANNYRVRKDSSNSYQGGDFRGIREKLDYVRALGCTAIWISPVVDNQGGGYHGYWAENFERVEEHFGTEAELTQLVDHAHRRGMKVIIDLVVNHTGSLHPWVQDGIHDSWFHPRRDIVDWNDPKDRETGRLANLPDLDQSNPLVRKYLIDMAIGWIDRVGHDGYRLDTLRHVSADFWLDFSRAIKAKYPEFYLLGESFNGDFPAVAKYQDAGIDGLLDFPVYFPLNDFLKKGTDAESFARSLSGREVYRNPAANGSFIDNHDVPRFIDQLREYRDERLAQALLFLYTYTGLPVLYYGTEIPLEGSGDHSSRRFMPWDEAARFAPLVAALNALRRSEPSLTGGTFQIIHAEGPTIAFLRSPSTDGGRRWLTVLNNSPKSRTAVIPLGSAGPIRNARLVLGEEWLGGELRAKTREAIALPAETWTGAGIPTPVELIRKARTLSVRGGSLRLALKPFTGALIVLE